jgi:hypothetical protein
MGENNDKNVPISIGSLFDNIPTAVPKDVFRHRFVVATFPKPKGDSGFPARVFAIVP